MGGMTAPENTCCPGVWTPPIFLQATWFIPTISWEGASEPETDLTSWLSHFQMRSQLVKSLDACYMKWGILGC